MVSGSAAVVGKCKSIAGRSSRLAVTASSSSSTKRAFHSLLVRTNDRQHFFLVVVGLVVAPIGRIPVDASVEWCGHGAAWHPIRPALRHQPGSSTSPSSMLVAQVDDNGGSKPLMTRTATKLWESNSRRDERDISCPRDTHATHDATKGQPHCKDEPGISFPIVARHCLSADADRRKTNNPWVFANPTHS